MILDKSLEFWLRVINFFYPEIFDVFFQEMEEDDQNE